MKKSQELSRKTWKMIAKNLIVLAVLAVAAFIGVMSWFTQNTTARADGIYAACQIPDGLEVAITAPGGAPQESDWKSGTIELNASNYSFLNTLTMAEVTGNGISFICPPIMQESSVAKVNVSESWSNIGTTPNKEYLSFDLHMRLKTSGRKVAFDSSTYFGPLDSNANFGNSVSGWSENSVIGAARLSVITGTNSPARKLLWVPAPHLYYDGETLNTNVTDTSNNLGLFTINGQGGTDVINTIGTYNHGFYNSDKTTTKYNYNATTAGGDNVTANTDKSYTLPFDVDICTLNNKPSGSVYFQDKVRVNIWIEGEDTESRALQVGGEFKTIIALELKNV